MSPFFHPIIVMEAKARQEEMIRDAQRMNKFERRIRRAITTALRNITTWNAVRRKMSGMNAMQTDSAKAAGVV